MLSASSIHGDKERLKTSESEWKREHAQIHGGSKAAKWKNKEILCNIFYKGKSLNKDFKLGNNNIII